MKNGFMISGLFLLLLFWTEEVKACSSLGMCNGVNKNKNEGITQLPDLVIFEKEGRKEGVSAAYGGTLKDAVVLAGGCNFPDIPAAEGGRKVYYDGIYVLRNPGKETKGWEIAGRLPLKAANGASITLPEGMVCIGGCNEEKALNQVWLLNWNQNQTEILSENLPDLPVAMDNLAAATDGKNIYVAGGNIAGKPENRCFVLEGVQAKAWKELPVYPGPVRLQPVAAVVEQKFYLIGGFQPVIGEQECMVLTNGLMYDPLVGKWEEVGEIIPEGERAARALVGAAGIVWNNETVICQGGVHRAVFKAAVDNPLLQKKARRLGQQKVAERLKKEQQTYLKHEPDWYKFNRQLLEFRPGTGQWSAVGNFPQIARAGAVMVLFENKLIIVNGETKPGIRSAGTYMIDLRHLLKK